MLQDRPGIFFYSGQDFINKITVADVSHNVCRQDLISSLQN